MSRARWLKPQADRLRTSCFGASRSLFAGNAIHTAASWRGERIETITFNPDRPRACETLTQLQALARAIPGAIVHPGHQRLEAQEPAQRNTNLIVR